MSLRKEVQRYKEFLEDNPPLKEDGGWLCPKCEACHRTEEDATECCMPDQQDIDQAKYERNYND
jgi:hypothetical protein